MSEAFLAGAVRTPIGRFAGALSATRPDDMAALVLAEVVRRTGLDPGDVDEVVFGAANQAGEDNRNVARMAVLLADFPVETPGFTVNRLCASGLTAIQIARQMIAAGDADVVVAGGVESMTRAPWVTAKPEKAFGRPPASFDTSIGWRFPNPAFPSKVTLTMPETAEEVATRYGLTRDELDAWALRSHRAAVRAQADGLFAAELVAVDTSRARFDADEGPRPDTTPEALAALKPVVHPRGVVTAGNSSPLNDGAAAVVVVSERAIDRFGLEPRARIVAGANAGVAPEVMGLGPIPASRKALLRAGWVRGDLDAVELNEAFASQSIACVRDLELDPEIVNADGGAIALGHPLGASGARIVTTLLHRLERSGGRRGLATMCVGVGQGSALLLERT